MNSKPTYAELERKLQEAEQILDTLRSHKVDAVIGTDEIAMMRLKEVEDQLHEQIEISSNRLKEIESIYQNVPIGLCILNTDLTFRRVNKHLAEMNGVPAEEHIGKSIGELFPDLADHIEVGVRRVLQTGEPQMNVELTGETPADPGNERHWLHHWLPLFSRHEEQIIGINMVIQEITDRKRYERKLTDLNERLEKRVENRTKSLLAYQKQLRSLASQLSKSEEEQRQRLASHLHDHLGQMLAISKLRIDMLKKVDLPEDTLLELDNIQELIVDALTYSRELMSDLKPPPAINNEDIRGIIEWLVDMMEKHDLKVIVEDDGQAKPARREIRNILLQSVREVLFNIVKHAEVDEAHIEMWRRDNQLHVKVEDKGNGFDVENALASLEEGGFGLFNISERLDLMGCSIDIDSAPGEGTRITITAPLKDSVTTEALPSGETGIPQESESNFGEDQKVNVMLVDDHQMVREGLKRMVNAEVDLQVIAEASNGFEAIELARKANPDVIIMDVNMPEMDGITATKQIMAELPGMRIVGLSLFESPKVIDSMRSAGAVAYITKNEAVESLCATIRCEAKGCKES